MKIVKRSPYREIAHLNPAFCPLSFIPSLLHLSPEQTHTLAPDWLVQPSAPIETAHMCDTIKVNKCRGCIFAYVFHFYVTGKLLYKESSNEG